jgi:hypothetical protein
VSFEVAATAADGHVCKLVGATELTEGPEDGDGAQLGYLDVVVVSGDILLTSPIMAVSGSA